MTKPKKKTKRGSFTRVKQVVVPTLGKLEPGQGRYVRFEDVIYVGSPRRNQKDGEGYSTPPKLAHVTLYDESGESDGEIYGMVIYKVMELELDDNYPDDTYVGKTFYVERLPAQKPGEKYARFAIEEVELQ